MGQRRTPPEIIEQIYGADPRETHEALATRLGLGLSTVRKYRDKWRRARQEAANALIAEHVARHIPDALSDLTDLRARARTAYDATGDPRDGQLWLAAIRTELEHVKPDDGAQETNAARDALQRRMVALATRGKATDVPDEPARAGG